MTEYSDDLAVFGELLEVSLNNLLAIIILPFLGVLGEGLLLALIPKLNIRRHLIT